VVKAGDVREFALSLPRSYEQLVRDRLKYKVGRLVYLSVHPDETSMGFAFPKEERAALVAAEPEKFFPPIPSDERYNWAQVRLAELGPAELHELVFEAWTMCVPKRLARSEALARSYPVPE
jgi:hypothetical protein